MTIHPGLKRANGEPAHIVQVVQSIDRGGLEMMAVDLAIALRRRGLRTSVLTLGGDGQLSARLRDAGVSVELFGATRYWSPASHAAVLRWFRAKRPAVVHTHHLPSLLNVIPAALAIGGARIVHTEHAPLYLDEQPRFRPVLRWAARATDAVALVADALVPYYRDVVGIRDSKLHVIANGVDTERFRPVASVDATERRRAAGLPVGRLLIGAVGRLAAVKNFGLLLRATARARAAGVPLALAFVGDGEERDALESMARDVGLESDTTFLGWRSDVADLIGTFDALAVTSTSEGLPLVVLEAMSSGVPVLSTAVGEIPRVLDGDAAGIIVPSNDVEAFAGALIRFASDPRLRDTMAAYARARVCERYSHTAMVDRYLNVYGLSSSGMVDGQRTAA